MNPNTDKAYTPQGRKSAGKPRFTFVRLLQLVALGIILFIVAKEFHAQDRLKQALDWIAQLGPWGAIIFIAIYVVATVLFIPGSVLTLGAGHCSASRGVRFTFPSARRWVRPVRFWWVAISPATPSPARSKAAACA
jgi:hypothetical protein